MARQEIFVRLTQKHSGGPVVQSTTYTTDGVVVKRWYRSTGVDSERTIDYDLAAMIKDSEQRILDQWESWMPLPF